MVRYRSRGEILSSINITPFTDIVLVLLIVFMIAAPGILNPGLDIDLPGSSSARTHRPVNHTVGMDRNGRIFLDGQVIIFEELKNRIAAEAAKKPDLRMVVNADASARHGDVIRVVDAIKAAGVGEVYVGTVKE